MPSRILIPTCVLMGAFATTAAAQVAATRPAPWSNDYEAALRRVARDGRNVLVCFSDGSAWCRALKREVFVTEEFNEWARTSAVLVNLSLADGQPRRIRKRNEALARKLKVRMFPTVVFLRADGAEIGRTGYLKGGIAVWLKQVRALGLCPSTLRWLRSLEEARELSRKSGKPILVKFWGGPCSPSCLPLEKDVFKRPAFARWASSRVVLLAVGPRLGPDCKRANRAVFALWKAYDVKALPDVRFLDARGRTLARSGYRSGGWIAWKRDAEAHLEAANPTSRKTSGK